MKIAVVGATGLVGSTMLKVLEERGFGEHDILAVASEKSVGRCIDFAGRKLTVMSVDNAIEARPKYAIFSAGASTSRQAAPRFAAVGCTVIDNSSCWRMENEVPLVVPEINMDSVKPECRIIANPNCSTIQMVLAVSRLHRQYGIRRMVISTYQSITGTGIKAIRQLEAEEQYFAHHNLPSSQLSEAMHQEMAGDYQPAYPNQIFRNLFPHGGDFNADGYTTEEQKLVDETRKILGDESLQVSATVVRVPVVGGHSEAVNVELCHDFDLHTVRQLIADTPGVVLCDDPHANLYPTPIMAHNRDEVFVGRVRRDTTQPNTLNLWIVADNLRKGAATNAVQILQQLMLR